MVSRSSLYIGGSSLRLQRHKSGEMGGGVIQHEDIHTVCETWLSEGRSGRCFLSGRIGGRWRRCLRRVGTG